MGQCSEMSDDGRELLLGAGLLAAREWGDGAGAASLSRGHALGPGQRRPRPMECYELRRTSPPSSKRRPRQGSSR